MAVTYTWEFPSHTRIPTKDGQSNVIETIHWRLNATDGVNTVTTYGSVGLDPAPKIGFITFEDIQKSDIEGWVEAKLNAGGGGPRRGGDVASLKQGLANQLAALVNPNKPISGGFNF